MQTSENGENSDELQRLVGKEASRETSNQHGCGYSTGSTCYRYTIMVCLCMANFGDYFCFDNPAALEAHILKDLSITESRYMLFYSSIHWLAIGACLFGGYIVDKVMGARLSVLVAASGITLAQSLFAGGALLRSYWTMVISRMLFGIIDVTLYLAIQKMVIRWFKHKELTFVIGLSISLGRAGTVANMNLMGPIYSFFNQRFEGPTSLGLSLFVGAGLCVVSALFASCLFYMDKQADDFISSSNTSISTDGDKFKGLKHFPIPYWLVISTMAFYLMALLSFAELGQVFFMTKYDLDLEIASNVNSIVFIIAAFVMPVVGIVVDKVGKNLYWMFCGLLLQLGAHLLLAFTFVNPYIGMTILGLSYSITSSAMWPCVAYIVHVNYVGIAFGIYGFLFSSGQAGNTYLAGYLADTYGYIMMEALFLTYSCVALVMGSLLYLYDSAQDGLLNLTKIDRFYLVEETNKSVQKNREEPMTLNYR